MHSILLQFGPITLRSYGLCMALGFLLGWWAAAHLCKRTGQSSDHLSSLLTWLMLSAVMGARVAYVIEHWQSEFAHNTMAIIRIDQGGLMFYGGFIGAALLLLLYARVYRQHLFQLTDLLVAVLPLGHALGRIGCFMHGCCYGKLTNAWYGVCFPKDSPAWWEQLSTTPPMIAHDAMRSLPVIPTQLVEAAANAALFVVLYRLYPQLHQRRGMISGYYLLAYAALRFVVEFMRGDPRLALGPLSISQAISLGVALVGVATLLYAKRRA